MGLRTRVEIRDTHSLCDASVLPKCRKPTDRLMLEDATRLRCVFNPFFLFLRGIYKNC